MHATPTFTWHQLEVTLKAKGSPKSSHPLVVLQGVFKRIFQQAQLNAQQHKLLWHYLPTPIDAITWQQGDELQLTLQLFNASQQEAENYLTALTQELTNNPKQNFTLKNLSPWQTTTFTLPAPSQQPLASLELDFYTPLPFKTANPANKHLLTPQEFIRSCQKRLTKLFNHSPQLPPAPEINSHHWHYWRAKHASKSQPGHTLYLNGCVGKLVLTGANLNAWLPWLTLFQKIGLGNQLTFSRGRFSLNTLTQAPPTQPKHQDQELLLKRPFIINSTQQGVQLALTSNQLQAKQNNEVILSLPLIRIAHLEIHSPCSLSTALIARCHAQNIPIALTLPNQPPLIMFSPQAEFKKNQLLAKHHHSHQQLTPQQQLKLAAEFIAAKINGHCHLISQRYQKGDNQLINTLQKLKQELTSHPSLEALKGAEGYASKLYFQWLRERVKGFSAFTQRENKTPAQDPFNILLNYCYTLLFNRLHLLIRLHGLDPHLGILHQANGRHPALVSDFIEIWRPQVDKLLLRLLGLKVITLASFEEKNGNYTLPSKLRYRLIQEFSQLFDGKNATTQTRLSAEASQTIQTFVQHLEAENLCQFRLT